MIVSLAKWWGIPAVDGISAVKCRSAVSDWICVFDSVFVVEICFWLIRTVFDLMPRVGKRKKAAKAVVISYDESHYDDSESSENFFDGVSKYTDSSSDDNMEKLLLKIFKKHIAKKMKKKFISSSSDVFRKHKAKKAKGVVKSDGSFSRFSTKYFRRVVSSLSPHQMFVIEKYGFKNLLLFDSGGVPKKIAAWISSKVDLKTSEIILKDRVIPITVESFRDILGLPFGGLSFGKGYDEGKNFILSKFGISSLPSVSYLDTVDFGERNVPIGFPRMSVWKEGMIKRKQSTYNATAMESDHAEVHNSTDHIDVGDVHVLDANAHKQFASGAVQNEQQTSPCCNHDVDSYVPLENDLPDNIPVAGNFDNAGDFNCASGYLPSMNTGNASTSVVDDGIAESFGDGQALVTPDVGYAKNFKNSSDERFSGCPNSMDLKMWIVLLAGISFHSVEDTPEELIQIKHNREGTARTPNSGIIKKRNSPDLIIVGESKFHDRCNNMTAQSDLIYNASILPTSTAHHASSSGGKIPPHGPRRVLAPAKYTSDPFVQLHRHFPISDVENRYYIVVCRLADSSKWHSYDAVNIDNVKANFYTFGHSLKKSGHEQLVVDPSFADAEKVQKSFEGAAKARRLDLCDMLFFPIHYQQHWFLFIVDVKDRMFVFLDSKHEEHSEFYENLKTFVVDNFQNLWNKFVGSSLDFSVFKTVFPPVPRQDYESDSGVFVMKFMEIWSPRILLPNEFSKQNINNIRVKYVNQIFFHAKNKMLHTEIEDVVLNWFNPEKFARQ
ncbi:hypothetical protein OsI_04276 [Oryza sativa Indica Group]|uniref:Ubiquitin-like protease family profile domain-containing protein n=1 Tax=Oryza sativa subsp. indica TaxID=39946 RepID=B8ABM1_ORYSI|nr:hypothetical protein OsI_04276 [Oryza sativa Indica Group]